MNNGDSVRIRIYRFDRVSNTLTQVATPDVIPGAGGDANSVNWSPDGQYIAVGMNTGDSVRIRIYRFDRASNTLTQVATPNVIPGDEVNSVNWSPDGQYVAAGLSNSASDGLRIYEALSFPSKNVIKNNTVYCNSGGETPSGRGCFWFKYRQYDYW